MEYEQTRKFRLRLLEFCSSRPEISLTLEQNYKYRLKGTSTWISGSLIFSQKFGPNFLSVCLKTKTTRIFKIRYVSGIGAFTLIISWFVELFYRRARSESRSLRVRLALSFSPHQCPSPNKRVSKRAATTFRSEPRSDPRRTSFLTWVRPYPERQRRESGRDAMNQTEMSRRRSSPSTSFSFGRPTSRLSRRRARLSRRQYTSLLILVPESRSTSMNRPRDYRFATKTTDTRS